MNSLSWQDYILLGGIVLYAIWVISKLLKNKKEGGCMGCQGCKHPCNKKKEK